MTKAEATIYGAISLVNAIANQRGATLGIELKTKVIAQTSSGSGIILQSENKNFSSKLINKTIEKIISKRDLSKNLITITLDSEIPAGYGLKSSSAISTAVAMSCAKIFKPNLTDQQILLAGVKASIESRVSVTGAYDDACSCYYGGFNVTNNKIKKRVTFEDGPNNLNIVIFIPKNRKRGNLKHLGLYSSSFKNAWELAKKRYYWEAMNINGLLTASALDSDLDVITNLLYNGAIGASVSGNGPSISAVTINDNISNIKKIFSTLDGRTIITKVNNNKATVYKL